MKLLLAVDTDSAHSVAASARRLFPDGEYVVFNALALLPTVVPETLATGAAVAVPSQSRIVAAEGEAEAAIDEALHELGEPATPTVTTIGDPGRAICDEAIAVGADVIVLGRSDRGWLSRLLAPSVLNHVVRHAPCAVLVVRHEEDAEDADTPGS